MSSISIQVKGIKEITRSLGGDLDRVLRPAFQKSAVLIEGSARGKVHTVTRKLQGSLGYELSGHGAGLSARIGSQPGLGQPRGYSESDTSRWKKPRKGKNKGDPQVYAEFEELGTRYRPAHPFLEPALDTNLDHVVDIIEDAFGRAFR